MKKILIFTAIFVLPLFLLVSTVSSETNVARHSIVIDAGHGGDDPGSTACNGYLEKDANLDIAKILKQKLLDNGASSVHMTREGDETLSNNDRYSFANSTDGEVLVSIHLNGSSDDTIDGTQGLYGKKNKDQKFTEMMHSAMWESLKTTPDFIDFGVTNFASGVLLKSDMPATIQETVFISDADECTWLKEGVADKTYLRQSEIANTLFDGLNNWFAQAPSGGGDDGGGNGGGNGGGPKCDSPPCNK